jgi:uncharacterized damage-inducible protein DinB
MINTKTIALCLMLGLVAGSAGQTQAAPAKSALQNDLVGQIDHVQKQIVDLLDAVPQDKFTWRPAPGVRSVAEVYLHIAFGNYGLGKLATGKTPPESAGFSGDAKKWDAQTTDKAAIKKILEASFDWVKDAIKNVPDKDLDKKVNFFGHDISTRAAMIVVLNHQHEHLGQSIAYARSNKIAPPWSKGE